MHFLNSISLGVGQWQHIDKLKKNQKPVHVLGTVLVPFTYNDFKEITTLYHSSTFINILQMRKLKLVGWGVSKSHSRARTQKSFVRW